MTIYWMNALAKACSHFFSFLLYTHHKGAKLHIKQECIPVGCVPPAAVAVGAAPPVTPPGPGTPCGQTHTCKHITLPQTSFAGGKNYNLDEGVTLLTSSSVWLRNLEFAVSTPSSSELFSSIKTNVHYITYHIRWQLHNTSTRFCVFFTTKRKIHFTYFKKIICMDIKVIDRGDKLRKNERKSHHSQCNHPFTGCSDPPSDSRRQKAFQ